MDFTRVSRVMLAGMFAATLLTIPSVASAQNGALTGKVVDQAGAPVVDAEVTLEAPAAGLKYTVKTDKKGEWTRPGMKSGEKWNVIVKKGTLIGGMNGIPVRGGAVMPIPDIVLAPPRNAASEAKAAEAKEMAAIAAQVNAAVAANDFDLAITKYTEAATKVAGCALCYTRIGDLYLKKKSEADAEKAYQKAIETDATYAEAYASLGNLYNTQKKYEDAAKMTAKAASLAPAGVGGGDPVAEYSAGAISVNLMVAAEREGKADVAKAKMDEAMAHFQKAIQLNPEMADAHYELGMLYVKQNKIPEAKKALAEYVRISPTGANAEMAKAIATMP